MVLRWRGCLLEILETVLLTVLIFFVFQHFIAQPYQIEQVSMEPTVEPGQYVLVDKLSPNWSDYKRGDVIVFTPPAGFSELDGQNIPFIKRVIGVAGDLVEVHDNAVYVNGAKLDEPYVFDGQPTTPLSVESTWRVPQGDLFVLGDHREQSQDSRVFGAIPSRPLSAAPGCAAAGQRRGHHWLRLVHGSPRRASTGLGHAGGDAQVERRRTADEATTMTRRFDLAIVGAGIIGLATAYRLLERQPDLALVVLEKESKPASHQSGHNSGVLHAGLYYPAGSRKAQLCREGKAEVEAFCAAHGIAVDRCGKLVVAVAEEELPGSRRLPGEPKPTRCRVWRAWDRSGSPKSSRMCVASRGCIRLRPRWWTSEP